jgi:hypothetical protein
MNEHLMPLGRLTTWVLVQLAGGAAALPAAAALHGLVGLLFGMALLGCFVQREFGRPVYALGAMAFFGITTVYQQAIVWFAASFAILALDTTLLALLAAQCWRRHRTALALAGCILLAGLAPLWFASGVLAGPLCCLYLLPREKGDPGRPRAMAFAPLLGTLGFGMLLLLVPRVSDQILNLEHYGGKTAWESFHLPVGLLNTLRGLVDGLFLGQLGITDLTCPRLLLPVVAVALGAGVVWCYRRAASGRLLLLGTATVFASYVLTYSARAEWDYDRDKLFTTAWSRYHLWPQLGLTLILLAVVAGKRGDRISGPETGRLSRIQQLGLAFLIAGLLLIHLPRSILGTSLYEPAQLAVLRQIDDVDAVCREHGVPAELAGQVLPPLHVPLAPSFINGWQLLRGSARPSVFSAEEARRVVDCPEFGSFR